MKGMAIEIVIRKIVRRGKGMNKGILSFSVIRKYIISDRGRISFGGHELRNWLDWYQQPSFGLD
jgi:hypothetical protein